MIAKPSLDGPVGAYSLHCFGPNVTMAFSGRKYPRQRYPEFLQQYEINPESLLTLKQVHGDKIVVIEENPTEAQGQEADGFITRLRGLPLGILTADCVPAFFWNPQVQVIGIAHAGWRGLEKGIIKKMLGLFENDYKADPRMTKVAFGPCIRQCCYEVGPEFKEKFGEFYDAKGHLDMMGVARKQSLDAGVLPNHLFESGICTHCEPTVFFSARREKTTERILSIIQLKVPGKESA